MLRSMRPGSLRAAPLPRIALFSDVDGTLLSATDRLAISARDVSRLASDIELILASSRTLVELADWQRTLKIVAPLIAENGAVISFPARWRGSPAARRELLLLGEAASTIRPRVRRCADDAGVEITDQREIHREHARAIRRGYSVCVRNWEGSGAERFLMALAAEGLEAARSGKWITITSGADKGMAARSVLSHARQLEAPFERSVSIGNEANDHSLLAATQTRFAIRNPRRGHHDDLPGLVDVHPLSASGVRAWREALAAILSNGKP